jgi:hypothetical protein
MFKLTSTRASPVYNNHRGIINCAKRVFGMVSNHATRHMKLGTVREKMILRFVRELHPEWNITEPAVLVHPGAIWLVCSPDAMATTASGERIYLEFKSSEDTENIARRFRHQVQMGMYVSGCHTAHVFLLDSKPDRPSLGDMHDIVVHADSAWQERFQTNAQCFYDTYLAWIYETPADTRVGTRVLQVLTGK